MLGLVEGSLGAMQDLQELQENQDSNFSRWMLVPPWWRGPA